MGLDRLDHHEQEPDHRDTPDLDNVVDHSTATPTPQGRL